jgi:hypothetical protein
MPGRWSETHARHHVHSHGSLRGPCLYEVVLRQAIATQYGLPAPERLDLRTCEGCGKAYLLATVWQPHSEEGEIACPRCGDRAVSWDGARGYLAYWHREGAITAHR